MAKYFKLFPKTYYTLANNATSVDTVTNIVARYNFDDAFKNNSAVYYNYRIKDGETPEIIADKLYGSSEKHWVILNYNNIYHPQFDWVLESTSLNRFIESKYLPSANVIAGQTGTDWAKQTIYGYFNKITQTNTKVNKVMSVEDIQLDANTYANTATATTNTYTLQDNNIIKIDTVKYTKTYFEYEEELNESKRIIRVVKPEFVADIEDSLRKANE
jgi:hypothetical protein